MFDDIYGLPQTLTGSETVTIHQTQNGQIAKCTMPLSQLAALFVSVNWVSGLPTTLPSTRGVLWNNAGVVSIS